jgi:hypothetical protein
MATIKSRTIKLFPVKCSTSSGKGQTRHPGLVQACAKHERFHGRLTNSAKRVQGKLGLLDTDFMTKSEGTWILEAKFVEWEILTRASLLVYFHPTANMLALHMMSFHLIPPSAVIYKFPTTSDARKNPCL